MIVYPVEHYLCLFVMSHVISSYGKFVEDTQ